jgi:hypothetical protein
MGARAMHLSISSQKLAETLRRTLKDIAEGRNIDPHDPSVEELKRTLLLRIAALETDETISLSEIPSA